MKLTQIFGGLLCALGGWALTACSADESTEQLLGEGKGAVRIALEADAGFEEVGTKAINESDYTNFANYTVQILEGDRVAVDEAGNTCQWAGNAIPSGLIELGNGSYKLLAFTGEEYKEEAATTKGMYVEGSKTFNVNNNQAEVSTTCTPKCARMTVVFDGKMKDYFSDYRVEFTGTAALGENVHPWPSTQTDPVYLAVSGTENLKATIKLTNKDGKVADDIVKSYQISEAKAIKMNIVPYVQDQTGNVGITITIDENTNDKPIDIIIPGDWI